MAVSTAREPSGPWWAHRAGGSTVSGALALLRGQPLVLAALIIWAVGPLAAETVHVLIHGGVMTGANGGDFFDQFQYLAWIRDEGTHLAASNLWVTAPTAHDYVQPMYLISGLLWRLGLSIQLAYLIWKPVAVLVLFLGCAWYVREHVASRWAATAALVLALFYESPAYALLIFTHSGSFPARLNLLLPSDDSTAAVQLWGFEHTAIAIGLTATFFICARRLLAGPAPRRVALGAALAGMLVAWLHPWQAGVGLGALACLFALGPDRRRFMPLALPVLATVLPLLYGLALSHYDPVWHSFGQATTAQGTQPWWAVAAALGPLGLLAALGLRRPADDREWLLVLWIALTAVVYLILPQFPPHALAGVTVPLAVLAVRGGARLLAALRASPTLAGAAAALGIAVFTLPALVLHARDARDALRPTLVGALSQDELRATADEAAALRFLAARPGAGGVLAPQDLSLLVPEFTGRPVFVGHTMWEPASHLPLVDAFFSPHGVSAGQRRAIVRASGARFVLALCTSGVASPGALAPLARPVWRQGCLTVYERVGA